MESATQHYASVALEGLPQTASLPSEASLRQKALEHHHKIMMYQKYFVFKTPDFPSQDCLW